MSEYATIHGAKLRRSGDMVVRQFDRTGNFEPESMAAWIDSIPAAEEWPSCTVFDVGAYTGIYSIVAAMNGARSIAVEPGPDAAARLVENLEANAITHAHAVTAVNAAAGAADGWGVFHAPFGLSSAGRVSRGGKAVTTRIRSIDYLHTLHCQFPKTPHSRVAAVKIDVEGDEAEVLVGMRRIVEEFRPVIIVETLRPRHALTAATILEPHRYIGSVADGRNTVFRPLP